MAKPAPHPARTAKPPTRTRIRRDDASPHKFPAANSTNAPTRAPRKKKAGPDSVRMMGYMARRGS